MTDEKILKALQDAYDEITGFEGDDRILLKDAIESMVDGNIIQADWVAEAIADATKALVKELFGEDVAFEFWAHRDEFGDPDGDFTFIGVHVPTARCFTMTEGYSGPSLGVFIQVHSERDAVKAVRTLLSLFEKKIKEVK